MTSQTVNGKIITYEYSEGLMLKKNMDGIETNITYTRGLQPETYTVSKGDTIYSSYTYTYSRDGNRLSEADSVNNLTRTYAYDNTGRLTGESISGTVNRNTVYTYDMRGNRTKETVTGDESYVMTNTYDLNNRLTKQTKSNGSGAEEGYQYYYDNNGNQTFKQRFGYSTGTMMSANLSSYSNDIESFMYNARNQLTEYTKGSTTASYTYSANGLRKSKTVGSTVTGFIWNGQNLAAETNGSTVKNIYSYGPDGIQCGNINGGDILYVKDAHGNTVTTLNSSKGSIRDYTYDAFGNQLSTVASGDSNPFRYCGEYYDNESGNIYLRARYYDSKNGRFITEDPIKDGLNWYSYCSGNPVNRVDWTGLTDSMVRYIVEKNGGTISYEPDTGSTNINMPGFKTMTLSSISSSGKTTVSVEGQADVEIDARVVNDRMIVDSQFMIDNFGLSENQATHQSNDSFNSLEDAIVGFGLTYYPESKSSATWSNGCEYGAFLYDNADGTFSFGNVPVARAYNTCDLGSLDKNRALGGWIHTHPNPGVGSLVEQFSGNLNGNGDGAVTNYYNVPGYLVAPSGIVYGLNTTWAGTNVNAIPANDQNVFIAIPNLF